MTLRVRRLLGMAGSSLVTGVLALTATATATSGTAWTAAPLDPSVVLARTGHVADAVAAVRASGGEVGSPLPFINGFKARVSARAANALNHDRSIVSVTPDSKMSSASSSYDPTVAGASYAASSRATSAWSAGLTGRGVTVAVLDTGVAPVQDLAGRLIAGPDFSGEGNSLSDTFGHGTVMAGLIAGNGAASGGAYPGIAPKANILSVKVAGHNGATDVSQILAAMQWIGTFASQDHIKVVSLAWGSPSHQSSLVDPLDYAVERLWGLGVTVVVSAGNAGPGPSTITKPGDDPAVVTVGAYNDSGTADNSDDAALDSPPAARPSTATASLTSSRPAAL